MRKGFTLIEILIGIALLAILLALVVVAINPAQRFQDARNTQRYSDVTAIMDAINLNMLANNGIFTCTLPLPTSTKNMADSTSDPAGYNICSCLVNSGYIASMPYDPSASGAGYTDCTTYNTQYEVAQNPTTLVITISAPEALTDGETGGIRISR